MKLLEKLSWLVSPLNFNFMRYHGMLATYLLNLRSHAIVALIFEVRICLAVHTDIAPVRKIAHKADQRRAALPHIAA